MGRNKTEMNITRHPGVGQAYVVQRHPDGAMVRVATLCTRDIKADPSLGNIRQFSGAEPYFKARITRADGGGKCDPITLVFDCRSDQPCMASDGTNTYQWLDLDHKVAVSEGQLIVNDTPEKPVKRENIQTEVSENTQEEISNMTEPLNEETDFMDVSEITGETEEAPVATEEVVEEVPFTQPAKPRRKTWYKVVDGKVVSRRTTNPTEEEVATREEAEALIG